MRAINSPWGTSTPLFDVLSHHGGGTGRTAEACPRPCRACPCGVSGKDRDVLWLGRDAQGLADSSDAGRADSTRLANAPTDPQESGKWAQSLSEVAEQRAELRWQQGRSEGIQIGDEKGIQIGEKRGRQQGRVRERPRRCCLCCALAASTVEQPSTLSRAISMRGHTYRGSTPSRFIGEPKPCCYLPSMTITPFTTANNGLVSSRALRWVRASNRRA